MADKNLVASYHLEVDSNLFEIIIEQNFILANIRIG